jgi:hypothetical protein
MHPMQDDESRYVLKVGYIMNRCVILIFLAAFSLPSFSLECKGQVTKILDWPSKCSTGIAYQLESSNDKWICSISPQSDSMILTAFAADKTVISIISTGVAAGDSTCTILSTHYLKHQYIVVEK